MEFKKFTLSVLPFLILGLFISSCKVNEPHMPSWDVSLNVPLVKRNYTMMDLLAKSSDLKYYNDNSNLVYYSQDTQLDKINISDKLKIDALTRTASQAIGPINISADSINANVNYDWAPGLSPGMQTALPSLLNQTVSSNFSLANQFVTVTIQSGTISLTVSNNFPSPVSITLSNFKLKNRISGEIIAQSSQSITIPAKGSGTLNPVAITPNVIVKNDVTLECTINCSGSGITVITLPPYSFSVKAKFSNITASAATAKIPAQKPVVIDNAVIIDEGLAQGTKFSSLKISSGTLKITVDNNLDLNATVNFTIPNLVDAQQRVFNRSLFISRKQTGQIIVNNESLLNYTLSSGTGSPSNTIAYKISLVPEITNDARTIKSTDGISGTVSISSLQLSAFNGQLKPTIVTTERSAVSLNVQDLKNKLQFGQINFKNPFAQLMLLSSAQFELLVNGYIEGKNKLGQRAVIGLNTRTLGTNLISQSNAYLTINSDSLSAFFRSFTMLPDSLIVYAGGTLNPNYKTISVKNTDAVTGSTHIEFPLQVGIQNAVFKDSVNMDLSSDDRTNIKNINSLTAGIDISNGLAAAIDFSGDLYDSNNKWLTEFPPKSTNPNSTISIDGAEVNSFGEPTPKAQTVTVTVDKATANKISQAKYMRVTIKLNTTGAANSPVKFRTSDIFNFHAFASTNYQVTPKENTK